MVCYNCGHGLGENVDVPISPVTGSNILGTNRLPSQHESELIKETVANILPRLARLDEEVAQVQAVLDKLTAQRDRLRDYWTTHKRHLSPILRFPPEIMREIFLYSLLGDGKRVDVPTSGARSVLTPGQVCKFWRQVSLATPKMWSIISVWTSSPQNINFQRIDTWLQRSSQTPLSIYLDGYSSKTKRVLSMLARHIHRWEDLTIDIERERLLHELGEYMQRMLSVRRLVLESTHYTDTPSPMTYRVTMPKLRHLRLTNVDLSLPIIPELPWNQLVVFEVSGEECTQYLDYLRTATNLSFLDIEIDCTESIQSIAPLHWSLHTLDISEALPFLYDAEDGPPILENQLLDLLTLPNLQIFKGRFEIPPCRAIISLLSRSNCSLKSLQLICEEPVLEDAFVDILRCVPALSELHFAGPGFQDTGIAILDRLAQDTSLVPELRTLTLSPNSVCLRALVTFVETGSRANSTSILSGRTCLKLLILELTPFYLDHPERDQARSYIETLLQDNTPGLDVRLQSPGRKVSMGHWKDGAENTPGKEVSLEWLFPNGLDPIRQFPRMMNP